MSVKKKLRALERKVLIGRPRRFLKLTDDSGYLRWSTREPREGEKAQVHEIHIGGVSIREI